MKTVTTVLMIALVMAPPTAGADDGDARRGQQVYESRCIACHSLDVNRVGPRHRGVFGRRAGTVEGYSYSKAVRDSGVVWSRATLDAWLANPGQFIPGNRMGFRLGPPQDRADVIAYLRRNSPVRDGRAPAHDSEKHDAERPPSPERQSSITYRGTRKQE